MSFIQENIIELNLNLKKEYKLIQISDVHAVTYNDSDGIVDINEAKKAEELWYRQRTWFADKAGEAYTHLHMIPSKECLDILINHINDEKPNAAILSGDIIDYYSKSNFKLLKEECKRIKVPYVFCSGNHEAPIEIFSELTDTKFGCSKIDLSEFKLLSLDNSTKKVSIETLNYIKEELKDNKTVIIVMHIPLCNSFNKKELEKFDPYFLLTKEESDPITNEFIDLIVDNDNIKMVLCGHTHGHSETYINKNKLQCSASSGLIGWVNKIIVK